MRDSCLRNTKHGDLSESIPLSNRTSKYSKEGTGKNRLDRGIVCGLFAPLAEFQAPESCAQ